MKYYRVCVCTKLRGGCDLVMVVHNCVGYIVCVILSQWGKLCSGYPCV